MSDINFKEVNEAREVLELPDKATLEEIKNAYRRLSKKWHPDKCKKRDEKLCHKKMKEINKAHKTLLKYVENYRYSFSKEKITQDSLEERWMRQFGSDPLWGLGWDNNEK